MTYKDYFVVEVKVNGKIMRIRDGAVYLPFGSEYSILLKNLNTRKASVNVSVDGEDTLDNHSLILDSNTETELQGFLRGNVARNRFRFINKTKQIQDHRGDRADDGMIRIEFAYEKPKPDPWIKETIKEVHHYYNTPVKPQYYGSIADWSYTTNDSTPIYESSGPVGQSVPENQAFSSSAKNISRTVESNVTMDSLGIADVPLAEEGITVKGSECSQQFRYGFIGELEDSEAIVIQLKGITDTGNQVSQPVTVQTKLTCSTCGTKSKSLMKYCGNCGTFLE